MKKIIAFTALVLLLFSSGCINYFDSAEKTTSIEIGEKIIKTEIFYAGTLSGKGKTVSNCTTEIKELITAKEKEFDSQITEANQYKKEILRTKIILLKEMKNTLTCSMKKNEEVGELKINFENSKTAVKKLSELSDESFSLEEKEDFYLLKIEEQEDFFSSNISYEETKVKVNEKVLEVTPNDFVLTEGFTYFHGKQELIEIKFERTTPEEFPFLLVAGGFISLIIVGVIYVVWKKRTSEELFPKSEEEIKGKMRKELEKGLGTTEVKILSMEKIPSGYEAEIIIKTRKYNITFNEKVELKDYLKIEG